jgi:hypothetical protein
MSPSARPSNVDVADYTSQPGPLYTSKPDCNIWVCPNGYDVANINGKVMCKYYKSADYNQITLPDGPEGQPGGFYNQYYCPTGTKLVVIKGAVESKKYWCEGYTDARWLACPTNSPRIRTPIALPSPIYKSPLTTRGPSRRPLFYGGSIDFNGAIADALADPRIIKKLILGLSCAVNDIPSSIKIKSICKKSAFRVCLPIPVVEVEDILIDCKRMYPSTSPSPIASPVNYRQLQEIDGAVEVKYEYQPVDDSFTPSSVTFDDSPVLKEVAIDVSLTGESSTMVAYSMTSVPASEGESSATTTGTSSSLSAASRNAIVGIVVGCVALGAILVGGLVVNRNIKRGRREKLVGTNATKNPATDVTRWAFAPQTV